MVDFRKAKEALGKLSLSDEYVAKIDEEYAAQAAELLNFKTFRLVDATAHILDDGNSKHVEVVVKSMITDETISFDSKTFLAMNSTTKAMINMDGMLGDADFDALLTKVRLQMSCGLETVKVDHLPFYLGITSEKSFKQYYDDFIIDVCHNTEDVCIGYSEFLRCSDDERDKFVAIFEKQVRSGVRPCLIVGTDSLMNLLGIEDKFLFVKIMQQWKQSGLLYVSSAPSSSDKCRIKYHGQWLYAVVLPDIENGNSGNRKNSESNSEAADDGNTGNSGNSETYNNILCLGDGRNSGDSIENNADNSLNERQE